MNTSFVEIIAEYNLVKENVTLLNKFIRKNITHYEREDVLSIFALAMICEKEEYYENSIFLFLQVFDQYDFIITHKEELSVALKDFKGYLQALNNLEYNIDTPESIVIVSVKGMFNCFKEYRVKDVIKKELLSSIRKTTNSIQIRNFINSSECLLLEEKLIFYDFEEQSEDENKRLVKVKELIYNSLFLGVVVIYFIMLGLNIFDFMGSDNSIKIIPLPLFIFFTFLIPILLIMSWFYEKWKSQQFQVYEIILNKFPDKTKMPIGALVSFKNDIFHHIYQFIWIPFCFSSMYLLWQFSSLAQEIGQYYTEPKLLSLISDINLKIAGGIIAGSSIILNNSFITIVSIFIAFFSISQQFKIQNSRINTGFNFYWWDKRISSKLFWFRILFVGITAFTMFYIIIKLFSVFYIIITILTDENFQLSLFVEDYCGQGAIVDILWLILTTIFVFGILVVSGFYAHQKLDEYKKGAYIYFTLYILLFLILIAYPFAQVYSNIDEIKEVEMVRVELKINNIDNLDANLDYYNQLLDYKERVEKINSSIFNMDLITSPFIILLFQFLYILWRFILYRDKDSVQRFISNFSSG